MLVTIAATLAANAAFALVAVTLGEALLRLAGAAVGGRPQPLSLHRVGAALLVGLGGCALAGLPLGAAHLFRWQAFAAGGAVVLLLGRRIVADYARAARRFVARVGELGGLGLVCLAIAAVVGVAAWLAALAPPVTDDELTAHLPEARSLAETHVLHLTLANHLVPPNDFVYGNLPSLIETLYGEALTIAGVPLMHALHVTLLVGLAILVVGVTRELWGGTAALLALAGLALYADLVANAVTGLVDTGETAFAAGGVLVAVLWSERREPALAATAAALLGLAVAGKYTAIPTAALVIVPAVVVLARGRRARELGGLAAIVLVACGYWYVKNLVRFGNPVYPFYLGHPGLTKAQYHVAMVGIDNYVSGPRTLSTFLLLPSRYGNIANWTADVALVLAPLSLLAARRRRAALLLLGYVAAYTTYWFWLGAHQDRFLMPAVVAAIVLAAAALGAPAGARALAVVVAVAGVWLAYSYVHLRDFRGSPRTAVSAWLSSDGARYALGLQSRSAYLHRHFGCTVDAVDALERRRISGNIGIYPTVPPPTFPRHDTLTRLVLTAKTVAGVRAQLARARIAYALWFGKSAVDLSPDPAARPLLASARPIWHGGGCWLFRLASARG